MLILGSGPQPGHTGRDGLVNSCGQAWEGAETQDWVGPQLLLPLLCPSLGTQSVEAPDQPTPPYFLFRFCLQKVVPQAPPCALFPTLLGFKKGLKISH